MAKHVRIGLNGFGRIGRAVARIALKRNNLSIEMINTGKTNPDMIAYLLKYDSVYRSLPNEIKAVTDGIELDGKKILTYNIREPKDIPWEKNNIDIVIDCTGVFKTSNALQDHLRGSVKKVILTAPPKDDTPLVVLDVNSDTFDFNTNNIISNASCTTNCAAPMFKIINDNFKIISGFLTTTHSYTSSQQLLDNTGKTQAMSRAANLSIIPSTTGAARAVARVIPELAGKVDGMSLRVPTPTGSISDISCLVEKKTNSEEINNIFKKTSEGEMKNILGYEDNVLVSSDYIGSPYSCIFDANYTKVIKGNFIKIFGWYDNEWGYSSRLVDLVEQLTPYL